MNEGLLLGVSVDFISRLGCHTIKSLLLSSKDTGACYRVLMWMLNDHETA